jgi:hypothetical protein
MKPLSLFGVVYHGESGRVEVVLFGSCRVSNRVISSTDSPKTGCHTIDREFTPAFNFIPSTTTSMVLVANLDYGFDIPTIFPYFEEVHRVSLSPKANQTRHFLSLSSWYQNSGRPRTSFLVIAVSLYSSCHMFVVDSLSLFPYEYLSESHISWQTRPSHCPCRTNHV